MAENMNHQKLKIIEQSQVAPPPNSVPSTTLPLTFLDIPWFYCHPIKRIFFYEFPYSTQHFLQEALPNLKHSLSITLQHFFPFVSNLIAPPHPRIPYIRYLNGDSLSFTVAEYEANFDNLVSDSPQDVRDWHPLVPSLPSQTTVEDDGTRAIPLMVIQVTVIPNSGFSICLTFNHIAADGKSLHHFLKFWASVCKAKGDLASIQGSLPFHDRDKVKDLNVLKLVYLHELQDSTSKEMEFAGLVRDVITNKVRATLILSRDQVEKLKKWISIRCATGYDSRTLYISTFVVTCALMWVCMIKFEEIKDHDNNHVTKSCDELCHLVFLADCRDCLELSLPSTYFGNCLATGIVKIKRDVLLEENSIIEVASAIESEVRNLKSTNTTILKKFETLMTDLKELGKPGKNVLTIAGSPKLAIYDTDFRWGRPKKSDIVHIESSGSISLSDCREKKDGIEVGLALDRVRMRNFITFFEKYLNNIIA